MATEYETPEISSNLEKRLDPEETVERVEQMDSRSIILGGIAATPEGAFFGGFISFVLVFPVSVTLAGEAIAFGACALAVVLATPLPTTRAYLIAKTGRIEYAITEQRFMKVEEKILTTNEESVPVNRVRDAELTEDFLDGLLGTGDIKIEATRGDTITFQNVAESGDFYTVVQRKIQEVDAVDDYNA